MNLVHRYYCGSPRWARTVRERLLPWVLADVDLGADVLEIGPGPGVTTDVLRQRAARVTAVEIDARLAERLRRRLAGTPVQVLTADATRLPLPDAAFSAVVSFTMLHHVPSAAQQDQLLAEVARVLHPGGWFVGSDSTDSPLFRLVHLRDTMTLVDPAGFADRLRQAGFREPSVTEVARAFRFRARRPI